MEDTVSEQLSVKLDGSQTPDDMPSVFNYIAGEWLDPSRSPARHGPDLKAWTGVNWKDRIRESLENHLETFHTPNSDNTDDLFRRYLGIKKIKQHWRWQGVSAETAQSKLDALIKRRGSAVHRGKAFFRKPDSEPSITKGEAVKALDLVSRLVHATEEALGVAPQLITSRI